MDLLVVVWFYVPPVKFVLSIESCEDSSMVEVPVFLIIINLFSVDVFRWILEDIDWIVEVGFWVTIRDLGVNCLFFKVERDCISLAC